jgi:hypothetical protein
VARQLIPNKQSTYQSLSSYTAKARRERQFPDLIDQTRRIHRPRTFEGPEEALDWLEAIYQRDRSEGQDIRVFLGVEKNGLVAQLSTWFSKYGIPILALGGYASQTYVDEIAGDIAVDGRDAVLIYAGDFDPSGEDIQRDFVERTGVFRQVRRIALTIDQVLKYDIPPAMGKSTDTRAQQFVEKYGELVQVELDALEPQTLRSLYVEAINDFFDLSKFNESIEREREDIEALISQRE